MNLSRKKILKGCLVLYFLILAFFLLSCNEKEVNRESVIKVVVTATPLPLVPAQPISTPQSTPMPKVEPKVEPTPTLISRPKFIRPTPTPSKTMLRNQTASSITGINLKELIIDDKELGLSIKIPSSWEKDKKTANEIVFSGNQGNVWIKNWIYNEEINSTMDFYAFAEKIPDNITTFKEESTQLIDHDGITGLKISGSFGKAYREHIFLSSSKSYATMIVFTCNPDYLSEYGLIFNRMLDSLEIGGR
jgi:hypothetical protein